MTTTVRQLAELVGGELLGDGDLPILAARPLTEAGPGDLTFLDSDKHLAAWNASPAAAAVVPASVPVNGRPLIRVAEPLLAFADIVRTLQNRPSVIRSGIDPTAHIHPTATLGVDVTVGPFTVIGEGCVIGDRSRVLAGVVLGANCRIGVDCTIHPQVVLYDDCTLGERVVIHANAVLGADGFGYRPVNGRHIKVPQLGRIEIGDDVEIGAGTTIDRGTFGPTTIGEGTKIDNLVMIGHNCRIGRHNILCSQVGIAGSTTTGDYVVMAGQVGVADHVQIGDGVTLGARSGLAQDVPAGAKLLGAPARPDRDAIRIMLALDRLPDLLKDMRRLKQKLGEAGGD